MKEALIALLAALLLAASCALAEPLMPANAFWIIPDSDTRYLTEGELWAYSRETLRYIRNEILARAGYAFESNKFYNYFNAKPWYAAGGYLTRNKLSSAAWSNVDTVKAVERAMDKAGTENESGLDIERIIDFQNSLGGYGNMLNYGNPRGAGNGLTLAESDPALTPEPMPYATALPRSLPMPRYCYTVQYIIPDSDTRYLTEGELWAYSRETLRYIRNEILARHGYAFNTEKFAAYFGSKSWYVPGGYDDSKLSRLEWSNVETVKAVEKEMDALDITNAGFLDIEAIIYNQQNGLCPAW
ncbi:MAG: YARHG domain-containing protein [Clostridia bacterium]|nr:YARHG domain-containing protein [Clostridia bacterium]